MGIPTVFISYSHLDEPWKDRLDKHLGIAEKQGLLRTWNDRNLLGGDDWFAEIINAIERGSVAVLLVSHNSLTSSFILNEEVPRMLAQHKVQASRFYPIVVEYCDWEVADWLKRFNLRPRDGRPVGINKKGERTEEQINYDLAEIAKEIRLAPPLPAVSLAPEPLAGECPYLGLEAFTEDKEYLFFGRADFADALFAKVKRQNFVALVGPSGCGKSSVVQAGLFPRLLYDTPQWAPILFQPQENPFLSLAAEFIKRWQPQASSSAFINQTAKLAAELKDAQRLIEAIQRTVAAPDGRLLLVVDQFEELFTLCDKSDRRDFLDALLAAKDAAPVTILLTLRVDFMGQAQNFSPAFGQLLNYGFIGHCLLTRSEWEAVITGPARHAGLEFEPGLVNLILQEVAIQPDSLPLLEYSLKEMWHKRQGQIIGHELYEAVGKVEGAISQHADAVLQKLPEAARVLALRALTKLVRVAGEEGEADTRLRLPLSELQEVERDVLQTFVTARLLVTKREEGIDTETIEVAHEALIRRWEKLQEALDSDREFLTWRRRLDSRRKAWEQKGHDDKWLLYGGERDDAQRWLNERDSELTAVEIEFITWDDRLDFQIERILSQSPSLLPYSYSDIRKSWFTTLVFCREKARALSIAREIEDAGSRGWALSSIAQALAKMGLATESLTAARKIEGVYSRALALGSIAEALAKMELATEAREAATEALAAAREIEDAYRRANALSSITKALVKAGMAKDAREPTTKALAAAREIENANYRARALSSIAKAQAKAGMVTEALATAHEIKDRYYYHKALRLIFEALVEAGMAMEALAAAREIEAASHHARALGSITEALLKAGSAAVALRSIAEALVKAGLATEALAAARESEAASHRAQALGSIAEALLKAGLATEAREAATEALAAAREIEATYDRAQALRSIAKALVKAGLATEALAAARESEAAFYHAQALGSIAEALVKAGLATEALAAAREIEAADSRAQALGSIAEALLKAGLATEARAAAREIEDADYRAQALMTVADFWLEQRQADEAWNILEEAQDAINKVFYDGKRSEVMRRLAVILARLHSYRAARETAEQCSSSSDRLAAYTAILREYHIERDPSLARLFAEEEEEED